MTYLVSIFRNKTITLSPNSWISNSVHSLQGGPKVSLGERMQDV